MSVAPGAIHPRHRRPGLVLPCRRRWERGPLPRIGKVPRVTDHALQRVGRIRKEVVVPVRLSLLDFADLSADGDQRVDKPVELDLGSLSVGSIIRVPGTGKETVGGWKP